MLCAIQQPVHSQEAACPMVALPVWRIIARACAREEGGKRGRWRVGDRGREGNDKVIEGEGEGWGTNYKLLSVPPVCWITSQRMIVSSPSPKRTISRRISRLMLELLSYSRIRLLRRPAFLSSARFTLSSPPVKNVWHREISDASIKRVVLFTSYHTRDLHIVDVDISRAWNIAVDHYARFVLRVHSIVLRVSLVLGKILLDLSESYSESYNRAPASVTHLFTRGTTAATADDYRRIQSLENFSDRSFNGIFKFNALIKEMLYSF